MSGERLLGRAATVSSLASWLSLGVGLGLLGAEAFSWARAGISAGPHLGRILRREGVALPCSSWVGVERVVEWLLVQSVFVITGMMLLVLFLCTRVGTTLMHRGRNRLVIRRLRAGKFAQRIPFKDIYAKPAVDLYILKAYEFLDRRDLSEEEKVRPNTLKSSINSINADNAAKPANSD